MKRKVDRVTRLMGSLTRKSLLTPIEAVRDEAGKTILLKGHRRVTACRLLAEKNVPGFTSNMKIDAIEVPGATAKVGDAP